MLRLTAREWQTHLWLYELSSLSDWLLAYVSALGNRCDVFKQVGITGMSGKMPLHPHVLSPARKLSLGHMLHSHITLTPWLPAPHQHPTQPSPNPLSDHQLSCPHTGVTFTAAPDVLLSQLCPTAPRLEMSRLSPALRASGSRWWKSLQVGRKDILLLTCILLWTVKGQWFSSCSFNTMHLQGQIETAQKEIAKVLHLKPLPKKTAC